MCCRKCDNCAPEALPPVLSPMWTSDSFRDGVQVENFLGSLTYEQVKLAKVLWTGHPTLPFFVFYPED